MKKDQEQIEANFKIVIEKFRKDPELIFMLPYDTMMKLIIGIAYHGDLNLMEELIDIIQKKYPEYNFRREVIDYLENSIKEVLNNNTNNLTL